MDTDQLRRFATVVEVGSITKAANLLRISHGGLSKSLKLLETELGYPLLVAEGRGIAITDEGKRCYDRVKVILAETDRLSQPFMSHTSEQKLLPCLRIGTFEVFSTYFFGRFAASLTKPTRFVVKEHIPGNIERALLEEKIDLGITYIPVAVPGLDFMKVTSFEMGLFSGKDLCSESMGDLGKLPFAAPSISVQGPNVQIRGLDGWPDQIFPRSIQYDVDLMETGLELCRQGLAVMYLPRFIASLHNLQVSARYSLHQLKLPSHFPADKRDVFVVKRKSTVEDQFIKKLAKVLREVCKL